MYYNSFKICHESVWVNVLRHFLLYAGEVWLLESLFNLWDYTKGHISNRIHVETRNSFVLCVFIFEVPEECKGEPTLKFTWTNVFCVLDRGKGKTKSRNSASGDHHDTLMNVFLLREALRYVDRGMVSKPVLSHRLRAHQTGPCAKFVPVLSIINM